MSIISKLPFQDEGKAFEYLEKVLWPDGPVCPHCGVTGNATKLAGRKGEGKRQARIGLWKCNERECRKQFTVKVGTVFEHGRIPLHKMLQAVYLMCCSKKGISAHQLHRILQIQYKSAWFLAHRIREAMRDGTLAPMGGGGKIVEADETFIGNKKGFPKLRGYGHKMAVMSLVERGATVRSVVMDSVTRSDVEGVIRKNVDHETRLMTDTAPYYKAGNLGTDEHEMVNHFANEYVRGDAHTNTLEGYFSIFKRGMKGIYQHCSEKHLHRYVAEFDFRYNNRVRLGVNDTMRTAAALQGAVGKRLTYRATDSAQ
jgi:transposase-like protein